MSRAVTLVNNRKAVNPHQFEIQVNALPGLIAGKTTKEEAVDNLHQELLIN